MKGDVWGGGGKHQWASLQDLTWLTMTNEKRGVKENESDQRSVHRSEEDEQTGPTFGYWLLGNGLWVQKKCLFEEQFITSRLAPSSFSSTVCECWQHQNNCQLKPEPTKPVCSCATTSVSPYSSNSTAWWETPLQIVSIQSFQHSYKVLNLPLRVIDDLDPNDLFGTEARF